MYNSILKYKSLSAAALLLLVMAAGSTRAQQVEEFSILRENAVALNPAMVGIRDFLAGEVTFRKQFTQLNGAPYTAYMMMEGQVADKNFGIGGSLIQDQTGPTGKTGLTMASSYQLKLGKQYKSSATETGHFNTESDHMITFGLSISIMQFRLNGSELIPNQQGDPQLYTSNGYKIMPDVAFGVYYQWMKHLYVGISVPQIFGLNTNFTGRDGISAIKTVQEFNSLVGGKYEIIKRKFSIDPVAGEIGTRFTFLDAIWVGGTYRSLHTFVIDAGMEIKGMVRICYAYDYNFSSYSMDIGPTHELTVAFKYHQNYPKDIKFFSGMGK